MEEEWRDVVGYEGLYQVSNLGRVRTLDYRRTGKIRILKQCWDSDGYCRVALFPKEGLRRKSKSAFVHRLVGAAFIPNPEQKAEIDHINGTRNDNRVENLRWATRKENDNNPICLRKKRERALGSGNPMYGQKATPEHRLKLSLAHKGRKHSKEWIENTAIAKQKKVAQLNMDGTLVRVWDSLKEASLHLGLAQGKISSICRHYKGRKSAKGFKWVYYNEYVEM